MSDRRHLAAVPEPEGATSDRAPFIPGPGPGYVRPKAPPPTPATPEQAAGYMAGARRHLAKVGVPCACGCGPLVHRHPVAGRKYCASCGADRCPTYRARTAR